MKHIILVFVVVALAGVALSGCVPAGALSVSNVRSNACAAGDDCGVFMTITNSTGAADVLVAAKTDVAESAGLHTVVKDDQGGMKMTPVENIPVPAVGSVELKRGSLHIMLMMLKKELKPGDTFSLTLTFQNAGTRTVEATVQPAN